MLGHRQHHQFDSAALITTVVLAAGIGAAQDFPAAVPSALTGVLPIRPTRFSDFPPLSSTGVTAGRAGPVSDAVTAVSAGGSAVGQPVQSGPRPVTRGGRDADRSGIVRQGRVATGDERGRPRRARSVMPLARIGRPL